MRKNILITTVSAIVLMSASHVFAADEENPWDSFKAAVEAGGTVTLDNDLTVSAGGAITTYLSGTVIDGNGHTISAPVLDEEGNFRFINNSTTADVPLEIKNITFNGGHYIIRNQITPAQGGAIYNSGTIGDVNGGIIADFVNNYAANIIYWQDKAQGGAIYNSGLISNIHGNFEGNYAVSSGGQGGAIYNEGEIDNIQGDFTNNHAESRGAGMALGGALYNDGKISYIQGNFIGNYSLTEADKAQGGAIYNEGEIGEIRGDFSNNYVKQNRWDDGVNGGAIYNGLCFDGINSDIKIGNIYGNFYGNHAENYGGAIYNQSTIGRITGNFEGNYAKGSSGVSGGAIYNKTGTIGDITGHFINNNAESTSSQAYGGAIFNDGTIGNENGGIYGNFTNNYAESTSSQAYGGAIYNNYDGTTGNITGNFTGNYAKGSSEAGGGAIVNRGIIGDITSNFTNNYAESANSDAYGGAISNLIGTIGNITGDFSNNHAESLEGFAWGGAILNANLNETGTAPGNLTIEGSFLNNYAQGNEQSLGGAILSITDLTIAAGEGRTSKFAGNYVLAGDVKTLNAIFMADYATLADEPEAAEIFPTPTLTLQATTNGQIVFEDEIDGHEGYKIFVTGDDTGHVYFNNHIRNADITLDKTNLIVDNAIYLGNNDQMTVNSGNLTINSGHMMIKDLGLNQLHFSSLSIPNGLLTIASVDVDLANQTSGQISAENVVQTRAVGNGKIEVENIRMLSDGEAGDTQIKIVSDNIAKEVTTEIKEAVAPVYKYGVSYDAATGEFTFTRGDEVNSVKPEPAPDIFNQGVFASDVFMMSSLNMQNSAVKEVASMDPNKEPCMGRVWAMPFYSDDTIEYKNFYDVDSRNYGLIAGVDTRVFGNSDLSHVYTLFGAYSEGRDKYEGIKVENKSWLLGLKASVFSDNGLYGDAIVDIASHDMDADTFYGSDSHDTYGYGAALKAGYRHDVPCDRWLYDAGVMLSWQQIKGDDFMAKSGAKMKTDDYSRLSLMPQVKVGYRALKYWIPYALVRYNFVLDEEGSSVANDTTLPEIESKDYVEYGLGVETTTNSNHSGFAHVLRHDGGREGWAITAGYRYNF